MSKKDEILETLKSLAVAGLPLVLPPHGVALLTLANECFNSSGKLRQDKWNAEIASRIANLNAEMEQKIRETSNFASILASAQRGALEDMEEDKVSLYANVVINAIKNEDYQNSKMHIFLNLLRELTIKHIDLLKYLQNPILNAELPDNTQGYTERSVKSDLVTRCPWLSDDTELLNKIMKDLYNQGLGVLESLNVGRIYYSSSRSAQCYTTKLGKEFLAFIAEQENAND